MTAPPASVEALLDLLASDPAAPTSVTDRDHAREVHILDSLSGLEFSQLTVAARIADLGAGAGLPGLVLAAAIPGAQVELIEATGRKCEFMERAIAAMGLRNAAVVHARAEEWAASPPPDGGAGRYQAVTARAVARLSTLAELASPLLGDDGVLLAWKGARDPEEEAELDRAAPRVAMTTTEIRSVRPYPGSRDRHIHVLRKNGPTPPGLPRRPGMASKKPFGTE